MRPLPYTRQCFILAGLAFSIVVLVAFAADLVVLRHPDWMIADSLLIALGVALLVFRYESQRGRALAEKLRVIRDMNAFIRNELQVLYASMDRPKSARVPAIERSVERIDWALRELLPGGEIPAVDKKSEEGAEQIGRSA